MIWLQVLVEDDLTTNASGYVWLQVQVEDVWLQVQVENVWLQVQVEDVWLSHDRATHTEGQITYQRMLTMQRGHPYRVRYIDEAVSGQDLRL